jgi:hypothetical protein
LGEAAFRLQLLIYQAVSTGLPATAEPGKKDCQNPCNTVPFQLENGHQREVIQAYQAVERAVAIHDSAAWGAHIAGEFFAVTSNSDRPLDKAARMAGLDSQKVAGIAPFPLVSARMFEFGNAMVMISATPAWIAAARDARVVQTQRGMARSLQLSNDDSGGEVRAVSSGQRRRRFCAACRRGWFTGNGAIVLACSFRSEFRCTRMNGERERN